MSQLLLLTLLTFTAFAAVLAAYRWIGLARIVGAASRRPFVTIVACLAVVAALGVGAFRLTSNADLKAILPHNVPSEVANQALEDAFGGVDRVFIVIKPKDGTVWTAEVVRTIDALSQELEAAPYVDKVIALTNAKDVRNVDGDLAVSPMMEDLPTTEVALSALRDRVKANPVLGTKLVSGDDTAAIINVLLTPVSDAEVCARDTAHPEAPTLENLKARYQRDDLEISFTGMPHVRYDMAVKMAADLKLFLPASLVIMLGFLYLAFRSLRGMLLPFLVVASSLIGLYGFIGWTGGVLYLPYLILAPMFIAIAHNYGTQLISEYFTEVREAAVQIPLGTFDRKGVATRSIVKMGAPILLSVVTVIVGFVSMVGHPLPPMAGLGLVSAFGIVLAFSLTVLLTPAILGLLPPPKQNAGETQNSAVDRFLTRLADTVVRYRWWVLGAAGALVVAGLALLPFVNTDSNAMGFYKKDSEIYRTYEMMGQKFGGSSTVNVLLEAPSTVADEEGPMKSPAVLQWMERFQSFARGITEPGTGRKLVGDASSLADQIAYMHQEMTGDWSQYRVPDDGQLIAQYLLLVNQSDYSSFVDSSYRRAQVVVQLPDMGTRSVSQVVKALRGWVAQNPPPTGVKLSLGGSTMSIFELNTLLLEGQIQTIIVAVLIIMLCYMLVFRSVVAGLLSSLPLILAIFVTFGLMALFGINLDNITSILTGIMIGAGTDYTAYFLWRMRELAAEEDDLIEVYRRTMASIGKGILYNGLSVVVGFAALFASSFRPVLSFGFLISVSIFLCIVGALTVLPLAVVMVKPRFLRRQALNGRPKARP